MLIHFDSSSATGGRNASATVRGWRVSAALVVLVCGAAVTVGSGRLRAAQPQSSAARVKLQPRLVPGEVMRYQIEFQTDSSMRHGGAIQDPQGPLQLVVTWDAMVRLEVLGPADASKAPTGSIRVRTTYEKSSASVRSDTPDPEADGIEKQYSQLQGLSFEFTLGANGHVSGVRGLEGIISDEKARAAAEQWMAQLSGSSSFPAAGIVPGQHWSSDEPADSLPLPGLAWRTSSTYLRNEPCHPANPGGVAGTIGDDSCAVILTNLSLESKHPGKDATTEDRSSGVRTSGHWTSTGQSLSYVSLSSGWVVSATQSGTEETDITVARPGETTVHYAGTAQSRSSVSMVQLNISPAVGGAAPAVAPKNR
jgi:hypothetical protein